MSPDKKFSFKLPLELIDAAKNKIEKANERLSKSGAPLIEYTISESKTEYSNGSEVLCSQFATLTISRNVSGQENTFELVASSKIDPGTKFQQHTRYKELDDDEEQALTKSDDPCKCDHCEKSIPRVYMYIINNGEKNLRVGSGCADKFTGTGFKNWIKWADKLTDEFSSFESASASNPNYSSLSPLYFLKEIVSSRLKKDYKKHYEIFSDAIEKAKSGEYISYPKEVSEKTNEIISRSLKIFSKIDNNHPTHDDLKNFVNLVRHGVVTHNQTFLCSSIVSSTMRDIENEKSSKLYSHVGNSFNGEPGDQVSDLDVTCISRNWKTSIYGGDVCDLTFQSEGGDIYQWRTSKAKIGIEEGDHLLLSGKIKKHEEWYSRRFQKNIKSTVLKNCKSKKIEPELSQDRKKEVSDSDYGVNP